ncbi:lachesin-like [Mytilus trossulus]|uniref:lachesin-like n=1 Tax=Mytilus trossulus TaxID=6551 RepID=UPI0030057C38
MSPLLPRRTKTIYLRQTDNIVGTGPAFEISYEEIGIQPTLKTTLYAITCSVKDKPDNSNLWITAKPSDGGDISYFTGTWNMDFWYTVRNDSNSSTTVVFHFFGPTWEGQYQCVIEYEDADLPSIWSQKSVYLKYTTMSQIHEISFDRAYMLDYDRRLFLNNGSALHLECKVTGVPVPKVVWKKKGHDNFIAQGTMLDVSSVTEADSGFYFCTADNGLGDPVISWQTLEVKVLDFFQPEMKYTSEPVITKTLEFSHVWMQVVTELEVLVNGFHPPAVTWWKETESGREQIMIDSKSNLRFQMYDGFVYYPETEIEHKLIIKGLREDQVGAYVAKAENSLGVAELHFTIIASRYTAQR